MASLRAIFATLCLLAATLPATAAEAVYRWVDASGQVHYTQVAPRGIPYERVAPNGRSPAPAPSIFNPRRQPAPGETVAAADTPGEPEPIPLSEAQLQQQAELEAEAEARLQQIAQAKAQNCSNAREQFREFTTYARIRVADGNGGVRVLTEEERQARIAEAQEAIVLNCESG